ncbi:hypothetical protein [Photobacterium leiognathi]|uniref:hypothetical protein n=1 Tax=Photobacterium leiognathi TaxID=553611 RepID=UPI002982A048|nr:hypothetical protein [Photobacterium leiognathi]
MKEDAQVLDELKALFIRLHSVLGATSAAFFFALLSSGNNTINSPEIILATLCFCVSLPLNTSLAFFLYWFGDSKHIINRLYPHMPMWSLQKTIPTVAWYSSLLGFFFLISFYSYWFAIFSACLFIYTFCCLKNVVLKPFKDYLNEQIKTSHTE